MDGLRFDTMARSLTNSRSRRGALAIALAASLGLRGVVHPDDAAAKKKSCPPCKKRKQGKCKKTLPDGTGCAGGTCQSGRCVAAAPPPLPPPFSGDLRCQTKRPILVNGVCPPLENLDDVFAVACVTGSPTEVCLCAITVRGTTECVATTDSCTVACDDDHDCPAGHVCLQTPDSCCPANPELVRSCAPLCP